MPGLARAIVERECKAQVARQPATQAMEVAERGARLALSSFLRGAAFFDPITGEQRTLNDLLRRRQDLEAIVCPPQPTVSLRHGISRVH